MIKGKRQTAHLTWNIRNSVSVSLFFFSFFANPAILVYCMKSAGIQSKSDRKLMFGSVPLNKNVQKLNLNVTENSYIRSEAAQDDPTNLKT
jgi:hypothetical protein